MLLMINGITIFTFTILLFYSILSCSRKKKTRSNEIPKSLRTHNNSFTKSFKSAPVKSATSLPASNESTSNRVKKDEKCTAPAAAKVGAEKKKNIRNIKKVIPKTATRKKKTISKENVGSTEFMKHEETTARPPPTNSTNFDKTLTTCEQDEFQSQRPTTTEDNTVVQNGATDTGAYDNLTVPSEKEKNDVD